MPTVTLTSPKYQQFTFAGVRPIAFGVPITITTEEAEKIRTQYAEFDPKVQASLTVAIADDVPVVPTLAIANPTEPAPVVTVLEPATEDDGVPDITDLSDDDIDLIQIEVGKLLGKTIAVAEPLLLNTALNPGLALTLRKMYLEEVQKHPEIQKGLKEIAEKALEQL